MALRRKAGCKSARLALKRKVRESKDKLEPTRTNWNPENKMELAAVSYHL